AVDAPTEREPRITLRIVPYVPEYLGVDHPRAADLDPARALAAAAGRARAAAEHAREVDLRRRLGEREERRPEPRLDPLAEEPPREVQEHALQVGERDALVDAQPFDLVE